MNILQVQDVLKTSPNRWSKKWRKRASASVFGAVRAYPQTAHEAGL